MAEAQGISGTGRMLSVFVFLMLFLVSFHPGLSAGQQGGIGVDNDGPSFMDISIIETDSLIFVNVEVRDLNGWNDIFSVNVSVADNRGNALSSVSYMQYPSLGSASVATIIWNQTVGNYLDRTQSTWMPIPVCPWNPDNAVVEIGVRVSFAFQKFSGHSINILAMDRGQLTCEYSGFFKGAGQEFIIPLWFLPLVILAVAMSVIAVAVIVTGRKKPPQWAGPPQYTPPPPGYHQWQPGQGPPDGE